MWPTKKTLMEYQIRSNSNPSYLAEKRELYFRHDTKMMTMPILVKTQGFLHHLADGNVGKCLRL
jgi:hypothetical protein